MRTIKKEAMSLSLMSSEPLRVSPLTMDGVWQKGLHMPDVRQGRKIVTRSWSTGQGNGGSTTHGGCERRRPADDGGAVDEGGSELPTMDDA
jgi:hypothetical protein